MNISRPHVKQTFASYTDQYDSSDPKISLKIDHTYRVADLCDAISRTVDGTDPDLAWLCGMLHDVGRFEQVRRYNTFVDAKSVDHAQFGADLLFCEGLIGSYGTYDETSLAILETAIRNHSKYRIDDDIPEDRIPYCHILRDADKLDILRVNIDTPLEDIYNVSTEELLREGVSPEVKQAFDEHHAIPRSYRKTAVDILVSHISMVQELVYPLSRQIVRERGHLDKLLDFRSENPDTAAWFNHMREALFCDKI